MLTPNSEQANPFISMGQAVRSPSTLSPDAAVKHEHQTTHTGTNPQSSRFRRSSPLIRQRSLSAHRHVDGDPLIPQPAWHIELNPHANGGLHNAVRSVGSKIKRKLWVGTLGTHTDTFKDNLKRSIDRRMLDRTQSIPVWIPDAEFEKCYDEFCHQVRLIASSLFGVLMLLSRFCGPLSTTPSQMLQRRNHSTNRHLGPNTSR